MRLALVLPDGVGIRNFVLAGFLDQAAQQASVDVYHAVPPDLDALYAGWVRRPGVTWRALQPHRETLLGFVLRNALGYAQMYRVDTHAMRYERARPTAGRWQVRLARRLSRSLGCMGAHGPGIRALEALHVGQALCRGSVRHYRRWLSAYRPDVMFCSHQSPPVIVAPVVAARALGIPTATFIFSWDNLTTRGRIPAPFDHYLVWSEHMRDELRRCYPDIPVHRIHVVGTPQFDIYADRGRQSTRGDAFGRLGADPERPLICYSGGDRGTCPDDPTHLAILLELIRERRIHGNPQVVLRPSPVDDGSRYASVRARYPELLFSPAKWVRGGSADWACVLPLPEDAACLGDLVAHADLNVNMASTMTLDFALHDTPVVNVAIDVTQPARFTGGYWGHYYRFDHYRPVVELGAARVARTVDELAEHVNAYLDNPALDRENRRRLVALEVGCPLGNAGQRIFTTLRKIAKGS